MNAYTRSRLACALIAVLIAGGCGDLDFDGPAPDVTVRRELEMSWIVHNLRPMETRWEVRASNGMQWAYVAPPNSTTVERTVCWDGELMTAIQPNGVVQLIGVETCGTGNVVLRFKP
jgi:hypothetical protein